MVRRSRPQRPPAGLEQLTRATSQSDKIAALRLLKTEIIGHALRKRAALVHGLIPILSQLLAGKEFDEVRLQATIITGSIAFDGRASAEALIRTQGFISDLLLGLDATSHSPEITLATLQCLLDIASAVAVEESLVFEEKLCLAQTELANWIYTRAALGLIQELLAGSHEDHTTPKHINLIATLIAKTVRKKEHQDRTVQHGILDSLASLLASTLFHLKYRLPHGDHAVLHKLPLPVSRSGLFQIIEASEAIIRESPWRTCRLQWSPHMLALFPPETEGADMLLLRGDRDRARSPRSLRHILAAVPISAAQAQPLTSRAFPALSSHENSTPEGPKLQAGRGPEGRLPRVTTTSGEYLGTPLIACLIDLFRESSGIESLQALSLATCLLKNREHEHAPVNINKKERIISNLVIPQVVEIIKDTSNTLKAAGPDARSAVISEWQEVLQRSLVVFSRLTADSLMLQKTAVDDAAVPVLCRILKQSFDEIPAAKASDWTPSELWPTKPIEDLSREHIHALKCRAGALWSLCAVAAKDDSHRRAIIDEKAVLSIHDSMFPARDLNSSSSHPASSGQVTFRPMNNPPAVLVAACEVARAMARSVSVLRTSLIDAKISQPVNDLLSHDKMEVKIAATNVMCNLLLQFSPMREGLITNENTAEVLCEHAHSQDHTLRLTSLWALKHLILNANMKFKQECLLKLGPTWMMQIISTGSDNSIVAMGTTNAAGERVDLLNATGYEPPMEIDGHESGSDVQTSSGDEEVHRQNTRRRFRRAAKELREKENNSQLETYKSELSIQEQAMQFVRNLIGEAGTATEMTHHLLLSVGTSRFFEIIASKLRPRNRPKSFSQTQQDGQPLAFPTTQTHNQPAEILTATVMILVHVANGGSHHKTILMDQTDILRSILPLLDHNTTTLRVACLWLINNLTWVEDREDEEKARERAVELFQLGYGAAVKKLLNDGNLDVRERAKTAWDQMSQLQAPLLQREHEMSSADNLQETAAAGSHRSWER